MLSEYPAGKRMKANKLWIYSNVTWSSSSFFPTKNVFLIIYIQRKEKSQIGRPGSFMEHPGSILWPDYMIRYKTGCMIKGVNDRRMAGVQWSVGGDLGIG